MRTISYSFLAFAKLSLPISLIWSLKQFEYL
ncbi:hypothetical protein F935_00709 [Acinetobacter calcoaceticus ANC 3811]|uniref:Uncharacterized protein n=1 Tax=Acinetobacter calcoaceticus ANC 3811 TaxID=1217690 RepID=R8Y740_ACICA|nr:hypothetical protein F935_00709 [Acinetobacter calcoaceticus ANC 3811]